MVLPLPPGKRKNEKPLKKEEKLEMKQGEKRSVDKALIIFGLNEGCLLVAGGKCFD